MYYNKTIHIYFKIDLIMHLNFKHIIYGQNILKTFI